MSFHPTAARRFEATIPRQQTIYALQLLDASGDVQLEAPGDRKGPCMDRARVRRQLSSFDKLCQRHAADLPPALPLVEQTRGQPDQLAEQALWQLRNWAAAVLNTRHRMAYSRRQTAQLALLDECLVAMHESSLELGALGHATGFLYKHLFACPHGQSCEVAPCDNVYVHTYSGPRHDFLLFVSDTDKQELLEGAAALYECTTVPVPAWLPPQPQDQLREVSNRLERLEREQQELLGKLEDLRRDRGIASAQTGVRLLRWLLSECVDDTPEHNACRITGWTFTATAQQLEQLLNAAGIEATVAFSTASDNPVPPVRFASNRWNQPFRLFVDLMGTPGEKEIDPTPVVTLLVPLLFGFMFPDLGHGLVLVAAGLLLARRYKAASILVPCGLAASVFGLLFGEFFGIHGLLQSPLGHPMENPRTVLLATFVMGICIMMLGLLFSGIEAAWRGEFARWVFEEVPVMLLYLSISGLLFWPQAWTLSLLALGGYLYGALAMCGFRNNACVLRRFGQLLESAYRLLLATLSFLRVGAFALAHTAFSSIASLLLEQSENLLVQALLFVFAHLLIVAVESMIVLIQTTRLVVLEFFTRFLRFDGRVYQPMRIPPP